MPPKSKITREQIIDAAFAIARTEGAERINARSVAARLSCSTQPVMYHFAAVEDLKRAVYEKADEFHTACLMDFSEGEDPMLGMGLRYIRFAAQEPHLFRFLFQSNHFAGKTLYELTGAPELEPVFTILQASASAGREDAVEIFHLLFLFVHGCAAMLANNAIPYEERTAIRRLKLAYAGAVAAVKEGKNEKTL